VPWRLQPGGARRKARIVEPIKPGESSWMKWMPGTVTSVWLGSARHQPRLRPTNTAPGSALTNSWGRSLQPGGSGLAEWIAWQLEKAGYTTGLQARDFRPGGNFVLDMLQAAEARRPLAVLSPDFFTALYTQSEWAAAFAEDPTGALLPVRVRPCDIPRLLKPIVYIDLVGLEAGVANEQPLAGLAVCRMGILAVEVGPDNVRLIAWLLG
jgi:hypothetical protein